MAPTGHVELDELEVDAGGNFELLVSAIEHPGNWLPMTVASDNLLVRQTFRERACERRAELHIECLDPQSDTALDPATFATGLARVPAFVSGTAGLFRGWMERFSAHVNQLPPNDQQMCQQAGGDPSIYYHNSYWQLADDEALLIEFRPPVKCRGWNFQLSNYWMESLDYRYHRISVNQHTAVPGEDGQVQLVISRDNPGRGYPNWLTTAGHAQGAMLLRYIEASDHPPVHTRVVPFVDLELRK